MPASAIYESAHRRSGSGVIPTSAASAAAATTSAAAPPSTASAATTSAALPLYPDTLHNPASSTRYAPAPIPISIPTTYTPHTTITTSTTSFSRKRLRDDYEHDEGFRDAGYHTPSSSQQSQVQIQIQRGEPQGQGRQRMMEGTLGRESPNGKKTRRAGLGGDVVGPWGCERGIGRRYETSNLRVSTTSQGMQTGAGMKEYSNSTTTSSNSTNINTTSASKTKDTICTLRARLRMALYKVQTNQTRKPMQYLRLPSERESWVASRACKVWGDYLPDGGGRGGEREGQGEKGGAPTGSTPSSASSLRRGVSRLGLSRGDSGVEVVELDTKVETGDGKYEKVNKENEENVWPAALASAGRNRGRPSPAKAMSRLNSTNTTTQYRYPTTVIIPSSPSPSPPPPPPLPLSTHRGPPPPLVGLGVKMAVVSVEGGAERVERIPESPTRDVSGGRALIGNTSGGGVGG
ncbi:hypothetical protein BDZ91DRAFT_791554 [Kalaharituber pfeilii]|nr:hypothetical protein BDZ91DRAFT_791554 [Kalaharituber pfeilii]